MKTSDFPSDKVTFLPSVIRETVEVDSPGTLDGDIGAWIPDGVPHPGGSGTIYMVYTNEDIVPACPRWYPHVPHWVKAKRRNRSRNRIAAKSRAANR